MITLAALLVFGPPEASGSEGPIPYRDVVPMPAELREANRPRRKLGAPTTIFVNFDGVKIGDCSPSSSHENCHWINPDTKFDPWSGTDQNRVAILQAMRSIVRPYGIRVTGVRPPADEDYTMVVYGGTEEDFGSLGLAPAGDCWDAYPNQIAYAYLDGDKNTWINGGAATAVHEAAHTWGFDHISEPYAIMAPAGDNSRTYFRTECVPIVADADFTPGEASCPELSLDFCDLDDEQHDQALLWLLFGEPYVDHETPDLSLSYPEDGQYFQAPASFDAVIDVEDDLHPQVYERSIWVDGLITRPSEGHEAIDGRFEVKELPVGSWTFHVRLEDQAGNASEISFDVEVGEDPVPVESGCGCRSGVSGAGAPLWLLALLAIRRRRG